MRPFPLEVEDYVATCDIRAYASVGEQAFLADRMRQDAIIRKLEIIGEAVSDSRRKSELNAPRFPGSRSLA